MSHPVSDPAQICVTRRQSTAPGLPIDRVFYAMWAAAICTLLIVAVAYAPSSVRSNNARCIEDLAAQEHVSLEAFFQNPAEQNALAQAAEQCSR